MDRLENYYCYENHHYYFEIIWGENYLFLKKEFLLCFGVKWREKNMT